MKVIESLTKEKEQKTSTMQAVQSVLGGLKEEMANIRETIKTLRVENTKLCGMQLAPLPPPKPKLSSPSLDTSNNSSS